jgi:putative flippase GtrA
MPAEVSRLIRFGATGFVVAVVYVGGYTMLFHDGFAPFFANLIAFGSSVAVQYVLQTVWTFKRRLLDGAQTARFLTLIGMGLGYSSLIASLVGPAFVWRPWVSAGLVAVTLPVLNYIAYRLWVYGPDMSAEDRG